MRRFSLFLVFIGLLFGTAADVRQVSNAQQLQDIFNEETSKPVVQDIELVNDIDFSDVGLTLPLGATTMRWCKPYSGIFQGNNHTIKGIDMNNLNTPGYSLAGLFCELKNATIKNLTIDSSCSFTGLWSGGLSVRVTGSLTLVNVTNKANVTGTKLAGGFIACMEEVEESTVHVMFGSCTYDGKVSSDEGGTAGFISYAQKNTNMTISLIGCSNSGIVYGKENSGGFIGRVTENRDLNLTFFSCKNENKTIFNDDDDIIKGTNYTGGFVGNISGNNEIIVIMNYCENIKTIDATGRLVGGFVGSFFNNSNGHLIITNSKNLGMVQAQAQGEGNNDNVGGFVGYADNSTLTKITNCLNDGTINGGFDVGGFIGFGFNRMEESIVIDHCNNSGYVTARTGAAGGIIGTVSSFSNTNVTNCFSNGRINTERSNRAIGGLIGRVQNEPNYYSTNKESTLKLINNTCDIRWDSVKTSVVGGVIGKINGTLNLKVEIDKTNTSGSITVDTDNTVSSIVGVGGFIGFIVNNSALKIEISNSDNDCSIITTDVQKVGGFIGSVLNNKNIIKGATITFTNCENKGNITTTTGLNIGGFIGFIFNILSVEANLCKNNGNISIVNNLENIAVGGFIGFFTNDANVAIHPVISFSNTHNHGYIHVQQTKTATVGGLIGAVHGNDGDSQKYSITFESCSNEGRLISLRAQNDIQIGGLIGNVTNNGYLNVEMKGCSNQAKISALSSPICIVGGLIGWVSRNGRSNLTITGCNNSKTLIASGNHSDVGGFVGSVSRNRLMNITFENSNNTGGVTVETKNDDTNIGGIVGGVEENPSMEMTINFVRNNGTISASKQCEQCGGNNGGLVGRLDLVNDGTDFTFSILNSVNDGSVTNNGTTSMSCGLVCVSSESFIKNRTVEVNNSINRGFIHGSIAYGIASKVTNVTNAVSLGEINGSSSNPFFEYEKNIMDGCYVLNTSSSNFTGEYTNFSYKNRRYITTDGKQVHEELNERAMNEQYGKVWDHELNVTRGIHIKLFTSKNDMIDVVVVSGTNASTLKELEYMKSYLNKIKHIVNETKEEIDDSTVFNEDTYLLLYHKVSFKHDHINPVFVENDTYFEDANIPSSIKDNLGIISFTNGSDDYKNKTITADVELTVNPHTCHNMTLESCKIFEERCVWIKKCQEKNVIIPVIVVCSFAALVNLSALAFVIVSKFVFKQKPGPYIPLFENDLFEDKKDKKILTIKLFDCEDETEMEVEKDPIGYGKFGIVYKIYADGGNTRYAVKCSRALKKAKKEIKTMRQLDTQFVVAVYGFKKTKNAMGIVMEYFPLGSLQNVLQQEMLRQNAHIPMLLDIARAMAYLHSLGIIHRDLKPGNVLVCSIDPNLHPMCKFVSFFLY